MRTDGLRAGVRATEMEICCGQEICTQLGHFDACLVKMENRFDYRINCTTDTSDPYSMSPPHTSSYGFSISPLYVLYFFYLSVSTLCFYNQLHTHTQSTLAPSFLLEQVRYVPTPGPLHLLYPLPTMLFP